MVYNIIAVVRPISGPVYYYNFGTVTTRSTAANVCRQFARKYSDSITAEFLAPGEILFGAMDPKTGKNIDGIKIKMNPFLSGCMFVGFKPVSLPERQEYK